MLKKQKNQVFVFGIVAILGISLATPVAKAALDIERIGMCSQKDHLDGTAFSDPWRFEARIDFVDTGSLANINMTLPDDLTTYPLDYQGNGRWEYESWPTLYPTLTALQVIYPTGVYTFDFLDSSGSSLLIVQLDYSGIGEPGSHVDFTYPSTNGQKDIPINPTFTWTIDPDAGDVLGIGLNDYEAILGTMETLSWQPGPLDPEQNYWLYVTVVKVKDWADGPGLPTMTVGGDEFEYVLHIGYINKIGFTTGPTVEEALDIDRIGIMTELEHVDGLPEGEYPWDFEISVSVSDPGTLHHIDVTKPGASGPSHTIFEDEPSSWEFDPDKHTSLDALRADYPEGLYTLEFHDIGGTLLKTVSLDYSGLSAPASPVDFTYPSYDGQMGISTNPTFTWTIDSGAGDALGLGIDDEDTGEHVYFVGPVSMTTLSWSTGSLMPNHEYHLDVTISEVKNWVGPDLPPTMTVGDDEFTYYLTFDYINTISFTTTDMPPEDAAVEALINIQAVINQLPPESLHNENSANALINKIDAALAMIDAGLYQETLDKLENDILKKTNGCAETGMPDSNDWIITCEAQAEVYPIVVQAIELLESLI